MRDGLAIGDEAELDWQVSAEHVIHLGYPVPSLIDGRLATDVRDPSVSAVVFSTPFMILLMERAARKVIEPFLDYGEASVGASVEIDHLAGTPLGAQVRGVARVKAIQGKMIDFEVSAFDQHEQIGRGTHRRAVVRLDKVAKRIAQKANPQQSASSSDSWLSGVAIMPASITDRFQPHADSPTDHARQTANMNSSNLPDTPTLDVALDGTLATVTLNRPQKLNAVNSQMTSDWERLNLFLAANPQIRIVLVTGAGSAFCAGDDLTEVGSLSLREAETLSYRQARMYLAWEQLPQVFVGVVNGAALGGGCVAANSCDLRIAAHNATFGMPEVLRGWPPGYGVAQLTALVGKSRAMQMCLFGQPITARQALEFGLVQRVCPAATLMTEARQLAQQLLQLPPQALRETKRLVHVDEGLQPKTAFLADTAAYIRCLAEPDAREGIAAFKEKRPPRFPNE